MKKILSMVLFLAAAGVGFTLLPSCGGGKGENTKDVITLNNMAANSNKYFRFTNGFSFMEIIPLGGGAIEDKGDGTGFVRRVPCAFRFSSSAPVPEEEYITYEVKEARNGVPTKAEIIFHGFTLTSQADPGFLSFFNIQKQMGDVTITSLEFLEGSLKFEDINFEARTAKIVYQTDLTRITDENDNDIPLEDQGVQEIPINFEVFH